MGKEGDLSARLEHADDGRWQLILGTAERASKALLRDLVDPMGREADHATTLVLSQASKLYSTGGEDIVVFDISEGPDMAATEEIPST